MENQLAKQAEPENETQKVIEPQEERRDAQGKIENDSADDKGAASVNLAPEVVKARAILLPLTILGALLSYGGIAVLVFPNSLFTLHGNVAVFIGISSTVLGIVLTFGSMIYLGVKRATAQERIEREARGEIREAFEEVVDISDLGSLLRANQKSMEAFDRIARSQASNSFLWGIIAMFVGLVVVTIGAILVAGASESPTKYSAAVITASGGLVSGYISRTFLVTHRQAMEQMGFYFRQPLVNSYILTAERLTIDMDTGDKSKMLKLIVTKMLDLLQNQASTVRQSAASKKQRTRRDRA